ncbi:myotubularin-like phosphatase domain-containing protein [Phthorimaea operculella]|nr:myotubularin-like phosphatase domain-containing protein [Phthorimaea operculella]
MLTAGETLIVPSSVLDYNLMESARHFRSGRVPVWVWGRAEGAALLRSGELLPTEQSNTAESVLLEQVCTVYTVAEGAALLRSGELLPTEQSNTAESVLLEQVCTVYTVAEGAALLRSGELLPTEQSNTAESVLLEQGSAALLRSGELLPTEQSNTAESVLLEQVCTVYTVAEGAALLRSGELLPTEQSNTAESVLLEQVCTVYTVAEGAALLRSGELLPTEQSNTAESVLLEQVCTVYTVAEGAALLRSGELLPTEQSNTAESVLLEQVCTVYTVAEGAALLRSGELLPTEQSNTAESVLLEQVCTVYTVGEGAALLRSGELLPTEQSNTAESVLLEQVRRSHPKLTPPHVIYLCGNSLTNNKDTSILPSLSNLQTSYKKLVELCTPTTLGGFWTSYKKLVELCTPTTLGGFWVQDSQYYSILDQSRWLRWVANCIAFADEAAAQLANNVTVVLQEGDGVDYCAVVSCLTQLLVDPYYRTISGFQSLIQKEWIALGHPFCDRFGLPRPGNPKETTAKDSALAQQAPVFLLFLDCTWQLIQQFPSHFQFTETYLTTLRDCAHNHLFDTFLFNCPRDRELAVSKNFVQRPVWDWGEQFSEQDKALFYNPLYVANKPTTSTPTKRLSTTSIANRSPPSTITEFSRLEPCTSIAAMELWSQCYERWLLPLDGPQSGAVQYHVFNYAVLKDIQRLNEKLSSLSIVSNRHSNGDEISEAPRPIVSRFHPFSLSRTDEVRNLDAMQVSIIDASQLLDSQSLLNAPD